MKKLILCLFFLMLPYMTSMATVQNSINTVSFAGDGVSTSFPFNYNVYLASDLNVYTVTSGVITQLTINVNYTVTLVAVSGTTGAYTATVNTAGGSLPYGVLPIGTKLYLMRNLPYTQLINISDYTGTPAATWNQALDRATILSLQNYNRSLLQPITATAPLNTPAALANGFWCWDPTGTFVTNCVNTSGNIAIPITTAGYVNGSALTGSAALTSLTTTGNVGIGTVTTPSPLTVGTVGGFQVDTSGDIKSGGFLEFTYGLPNIIGESTNSGSGITMIGGKSSSSFLAFYSNLFSGGTTDNIPFYLNSGNTEAMVIQDNNGIANVGIGSINPGQTLDIQGTVRANNYQFLGIGTSSPTRVCVTTTGFQTCP